MLSEKPWRVEAVLQFCVAQFACYWLGITLGAILMKSGVAGFQPPDGFGSIVISTLSFQGAAWILALFFLRQHQLRWKDAFGFRGPQLIRALLLAMLITMIALPAAILLQKASAYALSKIGWEPKAQDAVLSLMNAKAWWAKTYLGVFAIVGAPVAEEFIFRGVMYPFLKQLGYPRLSAIVVSFVFAAIHVNLLTFVPLFFLALTWTWLYEETDNLLAPIAAHSFFNAANFAAVFIYPH